MKNENIAIIEAYCEQKIVQTTYILGNEGCEVWKVQFDNGMEAAVKTAFEGHNLEIEAGMILYLKENTQLPVPEIIYNRSDLLVMEWIESDASKNIHSDEHAAELLAALHKIKAPQHGFAEDTLIGTLRQPNPWNLNWIEFFRDHRLRYMAQVAYDHGHLSTEIMHKVDKLADKLPSLIAPPSHPSLLHGDIWGGNIIYRDHKVAAFIDPAIYFGHREIEIAFTLMFDTFNKRFYEVYNDHFTLDRAFFDTRVPIYNLYSLLVHCRLFGGSYIEETNMVLNRFVANNTN
ncbi:fructosamine kinase family protein [Curvivirga sp.]|uniref:fructosamine kinase family protein n=1 Tax=Curvivirga sp. TaxID=2856848 RepID=UPI003B5A85D1